MKYSLTVMLNYSHCTRELPFVTVNSQRELYEIARVYLNDPEITSAVFTVVPERIPND